MTQVTETLISQIADAVVKEVSPQKIILFGSQVWGNPARDSDVDLLIVRDKPFDRDNTRFQEINKIRHSLSRFRVPKDILLYTADEVARWKDSKNHILGQCIRGGRVLYERH